MRQGYRKKRNYLIIGLCSVLVIMAVGFAAFSQSLQINGTSNITSNWDVHIKDGGVSYKNAVDATNTTAEKTGTLVATFACNLITPGKSTISYDIVVENKGSLNAKLDRINLTGGNEAISVVTSPTNTSLSGSPIILAPNDETTVTVTVSYNDINTQPVGEGLSTNITATLDFTQTNDSPVPVTSSYTGTIYRFNTMQAKDGASIKLENVTKWCDIETSNGNQHECFDTETECNTILSEFNYTGTDTCQERLLVFGAGDYIKEEDYPTASERATALGKNYYLKHKVENDIITESYVCFISDIEHCIKGGDNGAMFNANTEIIRDYQTHYSLNTTFSDKSGHCSLTNSNTCCFGTFNSNCIGGDFGRVNVTSVGEVEVYGSGNTHCSVEYDGSSACYE